MNPKFSKHIIQPEAAAEAPAKRKKGHAAASDAYAAMRTASTSVNFRLPAEKLAKFKARCAVNGDTMTSIFERAMDDYLQKT